MAASGGVRPCYAQGMTEPRRLWIKPLAAMAFAGLMALSAQLDVAMHPVPMTMQSWAVLLAGAALGLRWGVASVALYLAAAAAGLPVLAEGARGRRRSPGRRRDICAPSPWRRG